MAAKKKSVGEIEAIAKEMKGDLPEMVVREALERLYDQGADEPETVAASAVEHIGGALQARVSVRFDGRITKLQLHTRAHILGIQGTSDSLVVGDVIESIEPDMLGPIPGFVVRLRRGAPVFLPQASVLAVTVVG